MSTVLIRPGISDILILSCCLVHERDSVKKLTVCLFVALLVGTISFETLLFPTFGKNKIYSNLPSLPLSETLPEEIQLPNIHEKDEFYLTRGQSYQNLTPKLTEWWKPAELQLEQRVYDLPTIEQLVQTQAQVESFTCTDGFGVPEIECEALVALYESTNGAGWTNSDNWLTDTAVDGWYGVEADGGYVHDLLLSNNRLTGSIPIELANITNLWNLDLSTNQLTGTIPAELMNMTNLWILDLSWNQLTSTIPTELESLTKLWKLDLSANQLTGTIPTKMESLISLAHLDLSGNQLIGTIPTQLGKLTNLERLFLAYNQLSGNIPAELGNLANLSNLQLYNNQLTGLIPKELSNLTKLIILDLSGNQLSGNIPTDLDRLTNLSTLVLNNNQLIGTIPIELANLENLYGLLLAGNQLTGSIPSELGNLTAMHELDLSRNQLTGSIPSELSALNDLSVLYLNSNHLSGDIPVELGNLINLYALELSYNNLNVPAHESLEDFLAAKNPYWYLTQAVEEVISGETGGTLISNDNNTIVEIPEGVPYETFTVLFDPQLTPSQETSWFNFAGNSFELTIDEGTITSLTKPILLTLKYDPSLLGLIPEESLILYYWDENLTAWTDAATTCEGGEYTRNLPEDWFSLPICHLSEFALMDLPSFEIYLPMIKR